MWIRSHSKVMKSVNKEAIWDCWSDVNRWHEWVPNVEYCRLERPFQTGSQFTLKPKGFPAVPVQLMDVERGQKFTGCTRFFGATMYDTHEMHESPEGVRLTVTLKVTGPLGFLWRMLVAEKIVNNLPTLLKNLASVASTPMLKIAKAKSGVKPEPKLRSSTSKKPKLHLITPAPKKAKPKPAASALKKAKLEKTVAPASKKVALSPKPVAATVKKLKLKTSTSALKKNKPKLKDLAAQKTKAKPKASAPKKTKVPSKLKSKLKPKR